MSSEKKTIPFKEALAWAKTYKNDPSAAKNNKTDYTWYIVGGIILVVIIFVIAIFIYYYTHDKKTKKTQILDDLCLKSQVQKPLAVDDQLIQNNQFYPGQYNPQYNPQNIYPQYYAYNP